MRVSLHYIQFSVVMLRDISEIPLVPFRAIWYNGNRKNKGGTTMVTINRDEFFEIDSRSMDERNRLTLGAVMRGVKRVRVLQSKQGEVLLQPLIEIPASEIWLWQNEKALRDVLEGFRDAQEGRISKIDLDEL